MAPKAKLSASQKAANKAAGIEKRKRTMAVKAAERRANDPVFQATVARAKARFAEEEGERPSGGDAPEAQQQGGDDEEEDEPITPATSNKAGKRPAPAGESSAAPSHKRPRTVTDTGSPVVSAAEGQDNQEDDGDAYVPEAAGEEDEAGAELPSSNDKSKGKARANTGNTASKTAQRLRRAALAGPLPAPAASKSAAIHAEFQQTSDRSLDVDLDDPLVINNSRLIWNVCERCASHLEHGHTCHDGSDAPFHPRRCARCAKNNGKCVWLRPSSHSGLYEGLNNTIRAWLEWEESARGEDEEETLRTQASFREHNDRFLSHLRSFQGTRRQRIGAQATPHKRGGAAAAGSSGDLDNVVDQMQRMVAVGESLVDYASLAAKMVLANAVDQNNGESVMAAAIGNTIQRVIQRHAAWGQVTEPMFPMAPGRRRSASAPPGPQVRSSPEWPPSDVDETPAEAAANERGVRSPSQGLEEEFE